MGDLSVIYCEEPAIVWSFSPSHHRACILACSLSPFSFSHPSLPLNSDKRHLALTKTDTQHCKSCIISGQLQVFKTETPATLPQSLQWTPGFKTILLFPIGTVWSCRKPAVRRSSPTHLCSWQAPSLCPCQAGKCYTLCPHYHTPY